MKKSPNKDPKQALTQVGPKQLELLFRQIERAALPRTPEKRKQEQRDVLRLLEQCKPISEQGGIWSELLVWATNRGELPIIRALIDLGIDVNVPLRSISILGLTCPEKQIKVASLLIEAGASTALKDGFGCTPLHWACSHSTAKSRRIDLQFFDLFLSAHDIINEPNNTSTYPIEHLSGPDSGDLSYHFDYLRRKGASLDKLLYRGASAVSGAAQSGQIGILNRLLDYGAAITIVPEGFSEQSAIDRFFMEIKRHAPGSICHLEKADFTGKNRPFVVPKARRSKLLDPLQGVWRPELPAPKKVTRIIPPLFIHLWVDRDYSGFSWPNRYTVEKWNEDVAKISEVRLKVTGNIIEYRYPLGNEVAWIRKPKKVTSGVAFEMDYSGHGTVAYEFSVTNDTMRIYDTKPTSDRNKLIWRRVE